MNEVILFFSVLLAALSLYNYPSIDPNLRPIDIDDQFFNESYDFVIVGGGSAGSVMTNRLTENPNWSVLLLEVGPDENFITDTPLIAPMLWGSRWDWNYTTVPQANACLHNGGRCEYPRGRVLGGSSTTNFMVYIRGNRRDYDGWAAEGATGWSYDEVLPYFILSEDNRNATLAADTKHHGTGGYLTVSNPPYRTKLADAYINGGIEMGFMPTDANAGNQTGFMAVQGTMRNGSRCSTAKAFVRPARNRTNLHVALNSFVTKIIFEGTRAVGVRFIRNGRERIVYARKEVIVSGGTINSAQLLMLSGVGPSDHLNSFGIPVIKDLPVGNNLHDHYGTSQYMSTDSILEYAKHGNGPLTLPGGIEVVAFLNSSLTDPSLDYPDIEFHLTSAAANFKNEYQIWVSLSQILHPRGRGTIRLASTDPFQYPLIDPAYYTVRGDVQVGIEAFRYALALSSTEAMQQFNSTFLSEIYQDCDQPLLSDEYIECIVRSYTMTIFHPVGTCRMGAVNDSRTVVDPRLRPLGLQGIRIVDASVIPTVTTGNTNAPIIMIAERAAVFVKQDYS